MSTTLAPSLQASTTAAMASAQEFETPAGQPQHANPCQLAHLALRKHNLLLQISAAALYLVTTSGFDRSLITSGSLPLSDIFNAF